MRTAIPIALLGLAAQGCKPDLGPTSSLVENPRIIAVRGTPPEAPPGTVKVTYDFLAVSPTGRIDAIGTWMLCTTPKSTAETGLVASGCLTDGGVFLGPGTTTQTKLSPNACALYGPQPPPPQKGQPPGRPQDPDITGGFYQPLRIDLPPQGDGGLRGFGLERIACAIPGLPPDLAKEIRDGYHANQNPVLTAVTAALDGGTPVTLIPASDGGEAPISMQIAPGTGLNLQASWTPESAESYTIYDVTTKTVVTKREAMRVSWFSGSGLFALDTSGRLEAELETSADNQWTAPTTPGPIHLWAVLRDSRGGTDFAEYQLEVTP
jgi:hypothetical protein